MKHLLVNYQREVDKGKSTAVASFQLHTAVNLPLSTSH